jgi:hypothetical protein
MPIKRRPLRRRFSGTLERKHVYSLCPFKPPLLRFEARFSL